VTALVALTFSRTVRLPGGAAFHWSTLVGLHIHGYSTCGNSTTTKDNPAAPSPLGLLNGSQASSRSDVTNALKAIDPEAAAKAGVK